METARARTAQLPAVPAMPGFTTDAYRNGNIQFSDPWGSAASNPTSAPYVGLTSTSMAPSTDMMSKPYRQNSVSQPFENMSLSDIAPPRNMSSQNVYSTDPYSLPATTYATTFAEQSATAPPTAGATTYGLNGYTYEQPSNRNLQSSLLEMSRPSLTNPTYISADAMEASRGMMTLAGTNTGSRGFSVPTSQHRNSSSASSGYYPHSVGSVSTGSSISSIASYPSYYGSIGDSGANDIGSIAGADYDLGRPSLPRPSGMLQSNPFPHQAGMMTTFNSRVQTNTQKKHRCKVCDKRFTRPSSLQTHMYSHTGEKPFTCDVPECGRAFSVVSNLRRHRKVHKNLDMDSPTTVGSP